MGDALRDGIRSVDDILRKICGAAAGSEPAASSVLRDMQGKLRSTSASAAVDILDAVVSRALPGDATACHACKRDDTRNVTKHESKEEHSGLTANDT